MVQPLKIKQVDKYFIERLLYFAMSHRGTWTQRYSNSRRERLTARHVFIYSILLAVRGENCLKVTGDIQIRDNNKGWILLLTTRGLQQLAVEKNQHE